MLQKTILLELFDLFEKTCAVTKLGWTMINLLTRQVKVPNAKGEALPQPNISGRTKGGQGTSIYTAD